MEESEVDADALKTFKALEQEAPKSSAKREQTSLTPSGIWKADQVVSKSSDKEAEEPPKVPDEGTLPQIDVDVLRELKEKDAMRRMIAEVKNSKAFIEFNKIFDSIGVISKIGADKLVLHEGTESIYLYPQRKEMLYTDANNAKKKVAITAPGSLFNWVCFFREQFKDQKGRKVLREVIKNFNKEIIRIRDEIEKKIEVEIGKAK